MLTKYKLITEISLTFATTLRSIFGRDSLIMIGEIRDNETASKIAVRASITGHLVLSICTNDAASI